MQKNRWLAVLFVACSALGFGAVYARNNAAPKPGDALHIDIPVTLEKANVVFDVGHLVFNGDEPFFLGDLSLLANDYIQWKTKGEVIAVFHGDAAYLVLNDETYNAKRHVKTGNPYAKLIDALMKRGVHLELCGATAAANHWGNANLIPGIKVDTNAMVRVTQLEQQGFTLIYE